VSVGMKRIRLRDYCSNNRNLVLLYCPPFNVNAVKVPNSAVIILSPLNKIVQLLKV
jgi:hypothetical protein